MTLTKVSCGKPFFWGPMIRQQINFNHHWQFQLADTHPSSADWQDVTLPHDWSVEHPFDQQLDGATGYLPGGTGWYKKEFTQEKQIPNQRVYLIFDGIYNNSEVRLNGECIARHPYGYSPLKLDVTDHLQQHNQLLIKVDRRRYVDSRWYTGSGIYRDVSLVLTHPVHIAIWGNQLLTPKVSDKRATITQTLKLSIPDYLANDERNEVIVYTKIFPKNSDEPVCNLQRRLNLGKLDIENDDTSVTLSLNVNQPKLWSVDQPNLYRVETELKLNGETVDNDEQTIGLRYFNFDSEQGFSLNGTPTKIKGVCLHHDGGLVGAAVPDAVWRRRLNKLKLCGVNAIRSAHNPASTRFLNLCDELGFLVQEEFFDEWDNPKDKRLNMTEQHSDFISRGYTEHFQEHAQNDLTNTLLSRINHPCIFMWSIGNEIEWTYPRNVEATGFFDASWDGNYFWSLPPNSPQQIEQQLATLPRGDYDIGQTAQKLSDWVKQLDTSRPVTANCILPSASYLSGYADALDVIGFSYRRVVYDYGHQHYPKWPIIGNENLGQWHEWKAVLERPHVAGLFLWTGINYMGESHNQWPTRTTNSGLLDAAGFEKPSYAMFKTLWNNEPSIALFTQKASLTDLEFSKETFEAFERDPKAWEQKLWVWPDRNQHWNYQQGEWIIVEVYTNCENVELLLNDQSLGIRTLSEQDDHIMRWAVPFCAGSLVAREVSPVESSAEVLDELRSAGSAADVTISVESTPSDNGYRHVILQNIDADGNPVRHQQQRYTIDVQGAQLIGIDNGAKDGLDAYQSNQITTHNGKALVLVNMSESTAMIKVTTQDGLIQQHLELR